MLYVIRRFRWRSFCEISLRRCVKLDGLRKNKLNRSAVINQGRQSQGPLRYLGKWAVSHARSAF